jgi:hypothetical protein
LTVNYAIGGTATNGADYQTLNGSVVIGVGLATASIAVIPVDDNIVEGSETVVLTINPAAAYSLGAASSATVTIADNDLPASSPTIALAFNGLIRDRVGQAEFTANPDSQLDGVFTATLNLGSGNRTITRLYLTNVAGGIWDTQASDIYWTLGVAAGLDTPLLNGADDGVNFPLTEGGSFKIFASDWQNAMYQNGVVFTLTANFSDGSSASASATVP